MPADFDFKLTAEQETRAARLHKDSIVFDMLSQHAGGNIFAAYPPELQADFKKKIAPGGVIAAASALYWPYEMSLAGKSDLIRDWYRESGLSCGTYSLPVHDGREPAFQMLEQLIVRYGQLSWLRYVTTAKEIRQAKKDGVTALYAHWQPVRPAPRELDALDRAYKNGLRSHMLTYNRMDNYGTGCTERQDTGLSMFGLDAVKRCNELGIMVDVSHCSHSTTMDACRHSKKPVNANHTGAKSVYPHSRCKSNEALRAIAGTGGVIAVFAVPFFLSGAAAPTMEHMLDHIDYIADLAGWQHVAIGTDWPVQLPDSLLTSIFADEIKEFGFREQDNVNATQRLVGFDDHRDLPNITRGLVKRGYSDEQIKGILGENALRVFEAVCG